ncbi:hypothetical protein [Yersinia phage MHG19]|nr:hypothetical protein [Yersinia phage MHG19]
MKAIIAKADMINASGLVYPKEVLEKAFINYEKAHEGKVESMRQIKVSYDKAKAEGTITYR